MPTLTDLIQQRAFLESGGGEPTTLEKLNALFGNISTMATDWQKRRALAVEMAKTEAEAQALKAQQVPVARAVNAPEPEAARAALMLNQQKRYGGKIEFTPENQSDLERLNFALGNLEKEREDRGIWTKEADDTRQMLLNRINFLRGKKTLSEIQGVSPKEENILQQKAKIKKEILEPYGGEPIANVPIGQLKDLISSKLLEANIPLKEATTQNLLRNEKNKRVKDVFPNLTADQIKQNFGDIITPETNYKNALEYLKLNDKKLKSERMFPISALSPEGQFAAKNANLPDFIPESTARIINGANPVKIPSFEESTSVTTAESINNKLDQVKQLFPIVKDDALGFGKYQLNKYGQYLPLIKSDPQIVDFYTNIQSINNAMIYYMSGKQINEQEGKRIKSELLEPELNPDAFEARMNTVIENFNYLKNLKDKAITEVGKRNPLEQSIEKPENKNLDSYLSNPNISDKMKNKVRALRAKGISESKIINALRKDIGQ